MIDVQMPKEDIMHLQERSDYTDRMSTSFVKHKSVSAILLDGANSISPNAEVREMLPHPYGITARRKIIDEVLDHHRYLSYAKDPAPPSLHFYCDRLLHAVVEIFFWILFAVSLKASCMMLSSTECYWQPHPCDSSHHGRYIFGLLVLVL